MRTPSCLCALNEEFHKHITERLIKLNIYHHIYVEKFYEISMKTTGQKTKYNTILSMQICNIYAQKTKAYKTQRRLSLLHQKNFENSQIIVIRRGKNLHDFYLQKSDQEEAVMESITGIHIDSANIRLATTIKQTENQKQSKIAEESSQKKAMRINQNANKKL